MIHTLTDRLRELWYTEPARVTTAVVAALLVILSKLGIVLDERSLTDAVLLVLPVLLGGEAFRHAVIPVRTVAASTVPAPDVGDIAAERQGAGR